MELSDSVFTSTLTDKPTYEASGQFYAAGGAKKLCYKLDKQNHVFLSMSNLIPNS